MSEALIFASTNPQYDNRLFFDSPVHYMTIPSSEHVVDTNCFFCFDSQSNLCTQHVLSLEFSCTELVIQWTIFCGLFETRISASEKDLPVTANVYQIFIFIKISVWKCIYKFVSSFQMSCTASTFMQLPFRKGGNGTESLLPLSLQK